MKMLAHAFNLAFAVAIVVGIVLTWNGGRSPYLVCLTLVYLAVNAVAAVVRGARARRRAVAHEREESVAAAVPLAAGDVVLHGKVAYARGANQAMRMDFVQTGSENESSGSWTHTWNEIARKLTVQPFYLVRPDGTRVRVEPPPEQSRLFDELENKILARAEVPTNVPITEPVRGRFATLIPDETVWVTGRLVRGDDPEATAEGASGYRASGRGGSWILTGGPTLLVSSVSLAKHFTERARRHLRDATLYTLLLVGPLYMGYRYLDRVFGETVVATVESTSAVRNDDGQLVGHVARARHGRTVLESETLAHEPAVGSPLAFRVGQTSDNTGATARYSTTEVVLSFVLLVAAIALRCLLRGLSASALPWYRSHRIRVDEGGKGRLVVP